MPTQKEWRARAFLINFQNFSDFLSESKKRLSYNSAGVELSVLLNEFEINFNHFQSYIVQKLLQLVNPSQTIKFWHSPPVSVFRSTFSLNSIPNVFAQRYGNVFYLTFLEQNFNALLAQLQRFTRHAWKPIIVTIMHEIILAKTFCQKLEVIRRTIIKRRSYDNRISWTTLNFAAWCNDLKYITHQKSLLKGHERHLQKISISLAW